MADLFGLFITIHFLTVEFFILTVADFGDRFLFLAIKTAADFCCNWRSAGWAPAGLVAAVSHEKSS